MASFPILALGCILSAMQTGAGHVTREQVCLNGPWDFLPVTADSLAYPPGGVWLEDAIQVPSVWNQYDVKRGGDWGAYDNWQYPQEWARLNRAWHRRSVSIPETWKNKRLYLRFDGALFRSEIYVNGQRAGGNNEGFLPFEIDCTPLIQFGRENTIEVGVERCAKDGEGKYLAPVGSWWGWSRLGIWQDVFLEAREPVWIDLPVIRTSVRDSILRATVPVVNSGPKEARVTLRAWISDDRTLPPARGESQKDVFGRIANGKVIHDFGRFELDLKPGGGEVVSLGCSGEAFGLWWPHDPQLYHLVLVLEDEERVWDARTERFGFREVEIRETDLFLNGRKTHLRGDSWHWMGAVQQSPEYARLWYRMALEAGANCIRLHAMPHPAYYLDIADEMGMLIIAESAVYGSGNNIAKDSGEFWENAREACARMVRRDRNHPSIVLWSASNEVSSAFGSPGEKYYDPQATLEQAIRAEDPTRPVLFDGDHGLGGRTRIYSAHYASPEHWLAHWEILWKKRGPLAVNEFGALYYGDAAEAAQYAGDEAYASLDGRIEGEGRNIRRMIQEYRYMGAMSLTPWNLVWYALEPLPLKDVAPVYASPEGPGTKPRRIGEYSSTLNPGFTSADPLWKPNPAYRYIREAYAPCYAQFRGTQRFVYSGDTISEHLVLYNDKLWDLEGELRLGVTGLEIGQATPVHLKAGGRFEIRFQLPAPDVFKPRPITISAAFVEKDRNRATAEHVIEVVPRPKREERIEEEICLFDPKGSLDTIRKDLFARMRSVGSLEDLKPDTVLLVGEHAFNGENLPGLKPHLQAFLEAGGQAIALAQEELPFPLGGHDFELRTAFPRIPGHPILKGVTAGDLEFGPVGKIRIRAWMKPEGGPFRAIVDSGAKRSLAATLVYEIPVGKGTFTGIQFPLAEAEPRNPLFEGMLLNAVEYGIERYQPDPPVPEPLSVVTSGGSGMESLLRSCNVRFRHWDPSTAPASHKLLVDLDADLDWSRAPVRETLKHGGVVFVCGISPATISAVTGWIGADLALADSPKCHLAIRERGYLLEGMSNDDLYWLDLNSRNLIMDHGMESLPPRATPLIATIPMDWTSWMNEEDAEQIKVAAALRKTRSRPPARTALCMVPVERGILYLSTLKLENHPKGKRILSTLLLNAGVPFEVPAEDRPVPTPSHENEEPRIR